MVDRTQLKFDTSSVQAGLNRLVGPARVSLARSMGVAGGKELRDEAKARAPRHDGTLAEAIYLAFQDDKSNDKTVQYSVTWNKSKAPHGHLIEFGHWRYNKFVDGKPQKSLIDGKSRGQGPQDHGGPGALDKPVWVEAKPFLRPAYDAALGRAKQAMIERARVRLPEILAGQGEGAQ